MDSCSVTFLPHNLTLAVDAGETLIRAALQAGVHINASCGGEGICGKCRVLIEEGQVENGFSDRLNEEDIAKGYRLACRAIISNDVTIRIPVESSIDASTLNMQALPRKTASIKQMSLSNLKNLGLFIPPVEKIYLEICPPDTQNNIPDVPRLISALKEQANIHKCELTIPVIRDLPRILRENNFNITVTVIHSVRDGGKNLITHIQPRDTTAENYALAVDIGTTTIFGEIIDLSTGECLSKHGEFNSQISYGEDVISRIIYAEKPEGLKKLQEVVIECINGVLDTIIEKSGIARENISTITMAGNTTMTQLLLGIDPSHLRRAPYVPASTLYPPFQASTIGINLHEHTKALLYPNISSYVGGDIVAGVMGSGMYRNEEITLFMDIGTNAEIVIGNKDWLVCTACSAGPAFEGGGIEFGMRASDGAIEDFSIDPHTLEPMLITIGNSRPKGICGSGLITMTAMMFEMGVINNRGHFNRDLKTPRIREVDGIWQYVLAWKEESAIDRDISINELDIDNLIRAKGAIYSGCMTLLAEVGLDMNMIEHIILAGGFGSYIDLEKAMTIGLLPELEAERISFIGNASLFGAKMSSYTNRIRRDVVEVTKNMTNFELSETPSYMSNYVAAMFIPHTEIETFPKLKARMAVKKEEMQNQN